MWRQFNEFIKGVFDMQVRVSEEDIGRCGCGRSASGYCDGSHGMTEEQWKEEKKRRIIENTKPDTED
jgi:CDGSH-type Zn-finger protein